MRFLLLFWFISILSVQQTVAQTDSIKVTSDKIYELFNIERQPSFPGGETAMMQYISQNLKYPALARENGIQGSVVLSFVIEKDGNVSNTQIVRDIGGGCGKEAARVVAAMPKWEPGAANGQPIRVRYTLPIRYKLEGKGAASETPAIENKASRTEATRDEIWNRIAEAAKNIGKIRGKLEASTPFDSKTPESQKLLTSLEFVYKLKMSAEDKAGFLQLGHVSEYVYKSQFAPVFFANEQYRGQQAKIFSNRADFDNNADGIGKIGSIQVPQGVQVILYSKKKFKGKKLEINALAGPVDIPELTFVKPEKGRINDSGKGINWSVNTESVKIILPKTFPD